MKYQFPSDLGLTAVGTPPRLSSDGGETALPSVLSENDFADLLGDTLLWLEVDEAEEVEASLKVILAEYGHRIE